MKKYILSIFALLLAQSLFAQETATYLKGPSDWKYEKIDFPLDFAPEIKYQGFEELRFAPGMFDTNAEGYFSYAFAFELDDIKKIEEKELKDILEKYYKGLHCAVATSKEMQLQPELIAVEVKKLSKSSFEANVSFIDTFTNGQAINIKMEVNTFRARAKNALVIMAIASPQSHSHPIWKELYQLRDSLAI
ncbi:hypothetical protein [Sediminitomix flava]|nr:hypothetical protein [Sediminitomix flava]